MQSWMIENKMPKVLRGEELGEELGRVLGAYLGLLILES